MKQHLFSILAVALLTGIAGAQTPTQMPPPAPSGVTATNAEPPAWEKNFKGSDKAKYSYAIGMNAAANLRSQLTRYDVDIDLLTTIEGFADQLKGGATLIPNDQLKAVFDDMQKMLRMKQIEKAAQNKKEGEDFLAKNKNAPGVTTLTNGLQYKVITEGTGRMPTMDDEVSVNYRGTFVNGTEFDSNDKSGKPFTTRVSGGIIKGWTQALLQMKVGSKWQIYIPADLAYGPIPRGPIPGNSVLIFDLELLSAQPAPAPAAAANAPMTSDIIKVPSAEEMKKGAKIETIKADSLTNKTTNP